MEDKNTLELIDKKIKKERERLAIQSKRNKSTKVKLAELQMARREITGQQPVTLNDEELIYAIELVLLDKIPASKAFKSCSEKYHKGDDWAKRVIRFSPLPNQIERALEGLENDAYKVLELLRKHGLMRLRTLNRKSEIRGVLSQLKDWVCVAEKFEALTREVEKSKELLKAAFNDLEKRDRLIGRTARDRVKTVISDYPGKNPSELAKIANVSRTTFYKYKS